MALTRQLAVTSLAVMTSIVAGYGIEPLSPEEWATASSNWDKTMEARNRTKLLGHTSNGVCSSDIRSSFPTCLQYSKMWCWATAVAELSHFYKPDDYPETGNDCNGLECKIVGQKKNPALEHECCSTACPDPKQVCCKSVIGGAACEDTCGFASHEINGSYCAKLDKQVCANVGANTTEIVKAIDRSVGEKYTVSQDGPLTQDQLDHLMSQGHPVIIAIFWEGGGGHALTMAGCRASGIYYVHDPMNIKGNYQTLAYDQVASYVPPESPHLLGKWMRTIYRIGDLPNGTTLVV